MEFNDALSIGMDDFSNNEEMEIPEVLPMMAVRDVVIFNYMIIPLFVGRPGSVEAVNEALGSNKLLMLVTQKDATKDNPKQEDLYSVGMVCMVMRTLKLPDGRLKVLVQAMSKARIKDYVRTEPSYQVTVEVIEETEVKEITVEIEAMMRTVREQTEKIMSLRGILSADLMMIINNIEEPGRLADLVGSNLRLKIVESQAILEETDPVKRLRLVNDLLSKELEVSTVQAKIQNDAKEEMSKSQREYFLREQLHALQKELGDTDDRIQEIEDLERKLRRTKMPKDIRKEAKKQLSRMEMMHPDSSEATIIRTYIDWILDVPWLKGTTDRLDLKEAKEVLDNDHYGLDKVKERILEYLAVQQRVDKVKAPILCLVGPPGVGKTSLGQSIARATNRKFVRMALGGVRDESEIRGHRRTYIGSMPGKILQSLTKVGVRNPLFLLDEVDKMGQDFRGDPSSALLEVLDPEQNHTFQDHYIEVEYDLSDVMFVATANSLNLPAPLLDRMEVIRLSGYTEDEKINIAMRYLVPKQLKVNGIKEGELAIAESAIRDIVRYYTREAGVRSLEREISKICRKAVKALLLKKQQSKISVTSRNLEKYLGVRRFSFGVAEQNNQVGQVTGLAWTEVGGELLTIEAVSLPGRGKMTTTGKLGEVMQESIQAALSVVRSRARKLGIQEDFYQKRDIHIHLPEGATPKDGPSAGIAICTSMVSILTGIPVRADVAMTGEITLRGEVLPIGGLKEKLLAAHRGGIKTVLIPHENVKDLTEIPDNIKNKLDIHPVKWVDQVLELALERAPEPLKDEPVAEAPAIAVPEGEKDAAASLKH